MEDELFVYIIMIMYGIWFSQPLGTIWNTYNMYVERLEARQGQSELPIAKDDEYDSEELAFVRGPESWEAAARRKRDDDGGVLRKARRQKLPESNYPVIFFLIVALVLGGNLWLTEHWKFTRNRWIEKIPALEIPLDQPLPGEYWYFRFPKPPPQ